MTNINSQQRSSDTKRSWMVRVARVLPILLAAALSAGCAGYVPGEKAYWDARVRELCEKDGGVRIFQQLRISTSDLAFLRREDGLITVPIKASANPQSPAYAVIRHAVLHEGPPRVTRSVVEFIRRSDEAIVATSVTYARFGGDMPSHAHPSSFACPDRHKRLIDLQPLFVFEGDTK